MKKYMILLSALLIIATFHGCKGSHSIPYRDGSTKSSNLTINIMPVTQYVIYQDIENWSKFMRNKYGAKIELKYLPPLNSVSFYMGDYFEAIVKDREITGLIRVSSTMFPNVLKLADQGLILPLNEYIENNNYYLNMPDIAKEYFTDHSGRILGIPAGFYPQLNARHYRKEWLDNLNLRVPETLYDLYEVSRSFAYNDPNRSGSNDTIGFNLHKDRGYLSVMDIFYANGCFLSEYGNGIAFDWLLDSYEDCMLKPEALETMQYIKALLDEKIMVNVNALPNDSFNNPKVGNLYASINLMTDNADFMTSYYIKGISDRYLNKVYHINHFYVLTSDTPDPKGMANTFINTFYFNEEQFMTGFYGIEGTDYEIKGERIRILKNIGLGVLDIYSPFITSNRYSIEAQNTQIFNDFTKKNSILEHLISSKILFPNTKDYYDQGMGNTSSILGRKLYIDYFTGTPIAPEDFISQYASTMKALGAQEILDFLNANIGKTSKYKY